MWHFDRADDRILRTLFLADVTPVACVNFNKKGSQVVTDACSATAVKNMLLEFLPEPFQ